MLVFSESKSKKIHICSISKTFNYISVVSTENYYQDISNISIKICDETLFGIMHTNSNISIFKNRKKFENFHLFTSKKKINDFDIVQFNVIFIFLKINL